MDKTSEIKNLGYVVLQNDTPIFIVDSNDVESVSKAMVSHFGDVYVTVDNIYPDGELSFYDYMECEFRIIEIPLHNKSNALLISKASEMLQMLEEFVNNYENDNIDNFIMANSVDKAKELIKSATEI